MELLGKVKTFLSGMAGDYFLLQTIDGIILGIFDMFTDGELDQAVNEDVDLWGATPPEWKVLLRDPVLRGLAVRHEGRFTYEYVAGLLHKHRPGKYKVLESNDFGLVWLEKQIGNLRANMAAEIKIAKRL